MRFVFFALIPLVAAASRHISVGRVVGHLIAKVLSLIIVICICLKVMPVFTDRVAFENS